MTSYSSIARMLHNPTVWVAFLFVEWVVAGWLFSLMLPGDPGSYPTWTKAVVFVAFFALLTAANLWLRRRWIDPDSR
jgi:hypothetical protein